MQSIPPFGAWVIRRLSKTDSGKIVEAKPRQSKLFQQSLLYILSLNQRDLFCFHFAAILRELAVDFAADAEHLVFGGVLRQRGLDFFVEDGQAALEVFEVERARRVEERQDRCERGGEFSKPTAPCRDEWFAAFPLRLRFVRCCVRNRRATRHRRKVRARAFSFSAWRRQQLPEFP